MLPALGSVAFAQSSAPAAAPDASADKDVVQLSTFTVTTEKDSGYKASNSIAGTRTNTPIKDIPINIQVFTKELADDLLIKNQVQFEAYNASLVNGNADRYTDNVIQQSYQNFLFRGFRQNWGLRDGIREYDPIDTQGLARVEVVKGPAAPLYGLAYPGGVMNNISKTADLSRNFTELRITGGGEGDYRGTIDTNVEGALPGAGGKVGIRFNGAYEKTKDNRAHSEGDVNLMNLNLAWQATPNTTFEGLFEQGYRGKPNGLGAPGGYFQVSEAAHPNNHASIPLQVLHPEIPWTWNWSNGQDLDTLDTKLYRGTVTQKIGEDFQVRAYIQYSTRLEKSGNGWDANGSGGADSWESTGGWDQANNRIISTYNYRDWGNQMHAYGATGVYKADFQGLKNTFAFGVNVWGEKELSRHNQPVNQLATAIYYPISANIDTAANLPMYPPADTQPVLINDGYHHENNSNDYYFANWSGSLLNDRLKLNAGINRTHLKTITWNNGSSATPDNIYQASKWSPIFGAIYDVTKEVSVFLVHSTSLFPDSTKDSFGHQFSPQVGSSIEGGVKVELMNGKISGTVSYFDIKQTGGTQSDPNRPNRNTQIFDSLTPQQQQVQFGGIRPLGDIIQGGEQEGKGFDVDLVFQPTPQLQVLLSYEHVDHQFTQSAVPSTIGETYPQAEKDRYGLLGKYSFTNGDLKGLAVGLGISGGSKTLEDYVSWGGKDVARYEPARMVVEAFGSYRFKSMGYNTIVQFNVQNLTKESDYEGWQATGSDTVLATTRYKVPLPVVYRLTIGWDF